MLRSIVEVECDGGMGRRCQGPVRCELTRGPEMQSGRPDSNWRLPAPKAGALTRLRYAPQVCSCYSYAPPDAIGTHGESRHSELASMHAELGCVLIHEHCLDAFEFIVVGEVDDNASAPATCCVNFNPRSQDSSQFLFQGC